VVFIVKITESENGEYSRGSAAGKMSDSIKPIKFGIEIKRISHGIGIKLK